MLLVCFPIPSGERGGDHVQRGVEVGDHFGVGMAGILQGLV